MVWTLDKAKQYGWFALKLLTLIVAVWLIIRTLSPIPAEACQRLIRNLLSTPAWILGLLFSLSLANWGIEILKWKAAILSINPINFIRSARETLIAFSIGFVTPLKLGEYAVKTQFYREIKKQKVILRHFYYHFSQLLCTLL